MKKLALLSLIAASCAALGGFGISNGSAKQVDAAANYPSWYPKEYGTKRRIYMYVKTYDQTAFSPTGASIVAGDTTYSGLKHSTGSGDSYNEYDVVSEISVYFDISASANQITSITLTGTGRFKTATASVTINIDSDSTKVLQVIANCDPEPIISGAFISFEQAKNQASNLDYTAAATILEGYYSCCDDSTIGYKAITSYVNNVQKKISSTWTNTFNGFELNDISGYVYTDPTTHDTTKKCNTLTKIAMMQAMKAGTYGNTTLTVVSTRSTANSYLWVIAIAGTAAIASITTIVIAASKKKKQKEN